jgi:hypothetical protein
MTRAVGLLCVSWAACGWQCLVRYIIRHGRRESQGRGRCVLGSAQTVFASVHNPTRQARGWQRLLWYIIRQCRWSGWAQSLCPE